MVHFNTISIISTMSDTEISAFLEQELSKKGVVSVFTPDFSRRFSYYSGYLPPFEPQIIYTRELC